MGQMRVDSVLLASRQARRLHAWYEHGLRPDASVSVDGYHIVRFGMVEIMIDQRDDVAVKAVEPTRHIINIVVDDARAALAALTRVVGVGTVVISAVEERDGDLFALVADPDGNWVQLIEHGSGEQRYPDDSDTSNHTSRHQGGCYEGNDCRHAAIARRLHRRS